MTSNLGFKALPRIGRSLLSLGAASIVFLSSLTVLQAQAVHEKSAKKPPAAAGKHNSADQGFSDYVAISATLQKYLDAARTGDGSSQRAIWFDHAHVVGSEDGKFENDDADGFAKELSRGGPASHVVGRIADITVSGPAASARIEIQGWNGFRYTDFFLLYKHDGVWKISGKVFDSHDRN